MPDYRFAPPYELPRWPFVSPPELQDSSVRVRHPIVIVGGGLSGLTLACDLASRGRACVLLDEDDTVGVRGASSRGIAYAQKSLEVFARLGIYERIREKGITWSVGVTKSGDDTVYSFNMQLSSQSAQPPFINLQQFYLEWFLVDRIRELGHVDLRWKNRVTAVRPEHDHVVLDIETPEGSYCLEASWLIDATGANSPIREAMGLPSHPSKSADRWCITDVRFRKPLPIERWTWVDAPFNDGRAVWQHLMADDVWRLDYQMAPDADPEYVSRPEVAGDRIRRQLGDDVEFEFVWIGPYMYRHHLLDRFSVGRVLFLGDSAHVVSPFGARGGNTGIQDAANLGWKLDLVLSERAAASLIETYHEERRAAAAENLTVTSRTARFLAPRSPAEEVLRRAAISLAKRYEFARPLVNTGRMSIANAYPPSSTLPYGARSIQNVPLVTELGQSTTLAELLRGPSRFLLIVFEADSDSAEHETRWLAQLSSAAQRVPLRTFVCRQHAIPNSRLEQIIDAQGLLLLQARAQPGDCIVIRPDAYLALRLAPDECTELSERLRGLLFGQGSLPSH